MLSYSFFPRLDCFHDSDGPASKGVMALQRCGLRHYKLPDNLLQISGISHSPRNA